MQLFKTLGSFYIIEGAIIYHLSSGGADDRESYWNMISNVFL